jgi:adenosylmethionine-8-amino-7-oxononanoate aminotransferase
LVFFFHNLFSLFCFASLFSLSLSLSLFRFSGSRYPLTITRGKGCRLYDNNNKEYLDCVAGIATCALGHANPKLTQAIIDQMNQMHHVSNLYLIPQQAVLAKWLCDNSCADKVFFCNSGAEANEGAIKLARKHASMRGITVCSTFVKLFTGFFI